MKRPIILLSLILWTYAPVMTHGQSADETIVFLDRAIREAALRFKEELPLRFKAEEEAEKINIAVINFNSNSPRFNKYVMQEMTYALTGSPRLDVKEQEDVEAIRERHISEYAGGYVPDEKLVSLTIEVATQVVVVGELFNLDRTYRFRIRAVRVGKMTIESAYAVDLNPKEWKVRNLMGGKQPEDMKLEAAAEPETETDSFFDGIIERSRDVLVTDIFLGGSFAWGGDMIGGGLSGGASFYFSPIPLLSIEILFPMPSFLFLNYRTDISLLPISIGVAFPILERLEFSAYGVLHWLSLASYDDNSGLRNLVSYSTSSPNENGVITDIGLTPGFKTSLVWWFGSIDDESKFWGLELNYAGNWFKDCYVSSVGLTLHIIQGW